MKELLLVAAWFFTVLIPATALARQSPGLSVEDVLGTHSLGEISPLALSPDGKSLAYMVRDNEMALSREIDPSEIYARTGVHKRNQGGQIWISDLESGDRRNLTGGHSSNWDPVWSPNGRYLAFLSDREGNGQARLWVWDSTERGLRLVSDRLIRASHRVNPLEWTPDSRSLLITTIPAGMSVEDYARKVLSPEHEGELRTDRRPKVLVFKSLGAGSGGIGSREPAMLNLDGQYLHDLEQIEIETGKTISLVRGERVISYCPSPDGTRVAYAVGKRLHRPGSWQIVYDVRTIELGTMKARTIVSDVLLDYVVSWSPDGSLLAYGANTDEKGFDYYAVSANGGSPQNISLLKPHSMTGWATMPLWDPRGNAVYFLLDGALWRASVPGGGATEIARLPEREVRNLIAQSMGQLWSPDGGRSTIVVSHDGKRKQDGFYRIDLATGESSKVVERGECYTCKWPVSDAAYFVAVAKERQVMAYVAEDAQRSPDLWVTDTGFRNIRQLTHLNPQFAKYQMGKARLIEWLSDDGEPLRGALLLPPNYRQEQKVPLIVWAYSGIPYSDRFDRFGFCEYPGPLNMQVFATRGYAILFADTVHPVGQPADGLARSVFPGVNKVIEMGIADPQRIGVLGHSGAAYAALVLIARTKRFKAAIAADGWGDFSAFYGAMQRDGSASKYSEAEWYLGGPPWQHPLRYIDNSPIFTLDRIETPLLLMHGASDDNTVSSLADEIFVGLRRLGKQVEYAKYQGETHVPGDWSYENQVDFCDRMIAWFEKYLKRSQIESRN